MSLTAVLLIFAGWLVVSALGSPMIGWMMSQGSAADGPDAVGTQAPEECPVERSTRGQRAA